MLPAWASVAVGPCLRPRRRRATVGQQLLLLGVAGIEAREQPLDDALFGGLHLAVGPSHRDENLHDGLFLGRHLVPMVGIGPDPAQGSTNSRLSSGGGARPR